ncbi:NAD(+)/NADH kinase [Calidifontimicrobium sp. SYSU G02091]|uniref:NAD(+)/NADH kinase n=1 Tax=Calidifontimicrobium sp. SYSU G02091 TaxID=2926421 RepID=UPI001F536023|nr:NAD(+)/NADH kinase [Calidifontimicrobium sp. SYSU G02091]MCI1190649.1 NAD(+)/NADH kinase [Calidifontimicrobium sp. SYSU G02091]
MTGPSSPPLLGVVANPVSARDIRRVVANAGNLQITDRVNIVLRLLQAARAAGVARALLMPDRGGIRALLERHLKRGDSTLPVIEWLDFEPASTVEDSFAAARALHAAGARAIVVLGGDGTHRAVVRELAGRPDAPPIAGLSTGTNNAFPEMREPTITGLAAGLFAAGRIDADQALVPNKLLEVLIHPRDGGPQRRDIAIVDAVITHDRSVGARALWKTGSLAAAYLAFAEPEAIGLSSIGGLLQPVSRRERGGLAVQLAADPAHTLLTLHAPIAPGLVLPVPVASWQRMAPDEPLRVQQQAGTVALDGERELAFEAGDRVSVTLRENAFFTVDVARCMAAAARDGLLRSAPADHPLSNP